jgi:hypothetical protein
LEGIWDEMTEEELTAAFDDLNKESSQNGLAYSEHGTTDKKTTPSKESLSLSLDSFNHKQPDAETVENGTESYDNETESTDLASLFGENEDEGQDGQNGWDEEGWQAPFPEPGTEYKNSNLPTENSSTRPLLPSNELKAPEVLARPPKCGLTLPRPPLLTLPQTPQEFLQQHPHQATQQPHQQFQQQAAARASLDRSNPIHRTTNPKRDPKAAKAKQIQAPRLHTPRQPQGAGTSSVPSMASSLNCFGALDFANQYALTEIPQPENSYQHFATDSSQRTQSFATPEAQTTISNGSCDNGGHEYLGNRSITYPSQEQSFMRQTQSCTGVRARYHEQAPHAVFAANTPQALYHAPNPTMGAFSASPGSLEPPQGLQPMEIPSTGSRIEHEDTIRYSSPTRLSPRAQGWLNYWEALYFAKEQAMKNDLQKWGLVFPSYGPKPSEQQTCEVAREAFRQSFHQRLMRYGEDTWLDYISILDYAKHSAGHNQAMTLQEARGLSGGNPVTAPLPRPQSGSKRGLSDDAQIEVDGRASKRSRR